MTPLPKHLRPRYRYLAVTIESWPTAILDRPAVEDALETAIRSLFGDAGVAAAEPRLLRYTFDRGAGTAVVRTRRDAVEMTRAGVATVATVEGEPVAGCVKGISGTVRACEEKYLTDSQLQIAENTVTFEDATYPATVRGTRVDVHLEAAFAGATDLDLT